MTKEPIIEPADVIRAERIVADRPLYLGLLILQTHSQSLCASGRDYAYIHLLNMPHVSSTNNNKIVY